MPVENNNALEVFALLGCYVALTVVGYHCFGTNTPSQDDI